MWYSSLFFRFLFLISLLLSLSVSGQDNPVALGVWRSHLSYEYVYDAVESEDAVYFASAEAILKVNKEDLSLEHLNKVAGLNGMSISTLAFYKEENLLVVAYLDGNIDLMDQDGYVTNLNAIAQNKNITGDKSVKHIYCEEQRLYFSCSFGLVIYDLELGDFVETVFTQPVRANACSRLGAQLFLATNAGIYTVNTTTNTNIADFTRWEKHGQQQGLATSNYTSRKIIRFQQKIYADISGTLMVYENDWNHLSGTNQTTGQPYSMWNPNSTHGDYVQNFDFSLSCNEDQLIVNTHTPTYYLFDANHNVEEKYHPQAWRVRKVLIDQAGIHWAADQGYFHRDYKHLNPNRPYAKVVADLHVDNDGALWVASSNFYGYNNSFDAYGYFRYKDGDWTMFNGRTQPALDSMLAVIRVLSNPKNNTLYVSSFRRGLIEMDVNENIRVYDQYTVGDPISHAAGDVLNTRVTGLAVDDEGALWFCNASSYSSPLIAKKMDGTWKAFSGGKLSQESQVQDIVIDRSGYKWVEHLDGKITVFDEGDWDNDTDNRQIQLSTANTELPNNKVSAMAVDKKGEVWVGTPEGIVIFNGRPDIFEAKENNKKGLRPIIEQDNFNGYLLEGDEINDIAIDGGNRKWVATKNGLFLLSANGETQLAYFTAENSPLFNNEVNHLAIDGITGTLYIATRHGIQSYRGEATRGEKRMKKENVYVFPHPVEPGYTGPIAISNLVDDANVKITDISGRLVYETTALGGQAIWHGTDYNGRRVQSGVYLVFTVNEEGTQKGACRILFMN